MGVGNDQFGTCDSSLLTPHGVHLCLLDIASLEQSLPLLLSLLQPQLDRFLCSKGAAPILIASCRTGLIAAVISQQSTALPHYLKLPTRSSLKHLPALPCRVMGKLVCVTYSYLLEDGVTKTTLLEDCQGAGWEVHGLQLSWAGAEDDRCAESSSSLLQEKAGTILWILAEGLFCYQETLDFSQMGV